MVGNLYLFVSIDLLLEGLNALTLAMKGLQTEPIIDTATSMAPSRECAMEI